MADGKLAANDPSLLRIYVDSYVVPVCFYCARRHGMDGEPDVIDGIDEYQIREELGLEDTDELSEDLECIYCRTRLDLEEGFFVDSLSGEAILDLLPPKDANGRRIRPIMRDFLYKRDRRTCRICGKFMAAEKCTVHHVVAYSNGGKTSVENLVVACEACQQLVANSQIPRQKVLNTEYVRQLSAGEMEMIADQTYTEQELDDLLTALCKRLGVVRSGQHKT